MVEPIKTVSSAVVYKNRWITIHEDKTELLNGNEGLYGYLESKDSVMVAVLDEQNRICMLQAFRYPTKSWGWELPGGGGEGEGILDASKRELEEETGILADSWEQSGNVVVCNGLMSERMSVCIAKDIHFDGTKEESDEKFAEMKFFTFQEIDAMIGAGEINDCQTITGLYFAKLWLTRKENA
jgi:8-oxo-dGTP pyrophosphatase MutT (NUDIX family)